MAPMRSGAAAVSFSATSVSASSQLAGRSLPAFAHVRMVETLHPQAIAGKARLVGDPLLVDVVVVARQDAQHGGAARVDADGRAERVHDVEGFGVLQLPRARDERPRPVRQRADRAQVVHVRRQLRQDAAIEVGGDLHVLAAADGAQLLDARHFRHEADAARAVDAAVHEGLDQRADVLLFDGALVLDVARAAEAVGHRLVLQIALAALVADRAVERMVDEQEFHHAFARRLHQRAGGEHLARRPVLVGRQVGDAHGARGDGLGDALHLDEAHAAVAGDRQALVVAEARDLGAGHLARLQDGGAGLHLEQLAVDDDWLGHAFNPISPSSRGNGEHRQPADKHAQRHPALGVRRQRHAGKALREPHAHEISRQWRRRRHRSSPTGGSRPRPAAPPRKPRGT